MKSLSLLLLLGAASLSVHAQSTMPAMGVNTPKGEVAKTDASLNQTNAADKSNASSKTMKTSGKKARKTKTTTTNSMGTM